MKKSGSAMAAKPSINGNTKKQEEIWFSVTSFQPSFVILDAGEDRESHLSDNACDGMPGQFKGDGTRNNLRAP